MRTTRIAALAALAVAASAPALADDLSFFKSKAKAGLYEYKMQMDMSQMPGMPPGMGQQSFTTQHCLTQEDIDRGAMSRGRDGSSNDCQVKNVSTSGSSASYSMTCTKPRAMNADVKITFVGDGYHMDMKMNMENPKGGGTMAMAQHMDAKYLGACTK
ncbi:MAG TPA: DUF3617 domain-containing protein [Usitatibacter sp.]|nr:DUF3617 domain-containing protein [Usitatibacter sp.]